MPVAQGFDEPDPGLHLEIESFSETAMGWSRGLCIQLASIDNSLQRSAFSGQLRPMPEGAES